MSNSNQKKETAVEVEYENIDLPPVFVDNAQGISRTKGVFHVSFYSERIKAKEKLSGNLEEHLMGDKMVRSFKFSEPYAYDSNQIHLIRRMEANLIFTQESLERIIPWLQNQLDHMKNEEV